MVTILSDNIISPLGETTAENLLAVRRGCSALKEHHYDGMPEPFVASLFDKPIAFEEGLVKTISSSIAEAQSRGFAIDASAEDVIFIISSTKGNVTDFERIGLSARHVAEYFGNENQPIVVSNACISGLSAQILAQRLLEAGDYKYAIVSGYDVQSKFIVSGFGSFKAMSPDPCRPFDGDRCGLNLGEATASMILAGETESDDNGWILKSSAIRNDAVHISNPSKTGEGCWRAIRQVRRSLGDENVNPTCICAHGTATLFNDEMEAAAISHVGLSDVPTFSLKGYYGHTMGAAGIMESILALHAADEGWIPATKGFEEPGTRHNIHVTAHEGSCDNPEVLKLLSGFGGCNAALWYSKDKSAHSMVEKVSPVLSCEAELDSSAVEGLTDFYRQNKNEIGDYPKFYKMDPLCKLGFLASEILLNKEGLPRFEAKEDRAIVIFTRNGSMACDKAYQETIKSPDNFYPSPSVFVYTLSNIVTGEIALRNHYYGETSCYILEERDEDLMMKILSSTFQDTGINSIIAGWLDYEDDRHFEAKLGIYNRE